MGLSSEAVKGLDVLMKSSNKYYNNILKEAFLYIYEKQDDRFLMSILK